MILNMPIGVKDTFTMLSPRSRNRTLPVPLKAKNSTIWCSNSTLGYVFEEREYINSKRYTNPNVHSGFIYNKAMYGDNLTVHQQMNE